MQYILGKVFEDEDGNVRFSMRCGQENGGGTRRSVMFLNQYKKYDDYSLLYCDLETSP